MAATDDSMKLSCNSSASN